MKMTAYVTAALVTISLVAFGGCSGGTAGGIIGTSGEAGPSQAAACAYVQQWAQILWGLAASQTGQQEAEIGDLYQNPDGSVSQLFTGTDGTDLLITVFPDGSARMDITYPDATEQVMGQSVPRVDGNVITIDWEVQTPGGVNVEYTSALDTKGTFGDPGDDTSEFTGTSTLPGGLTQQFDAVMDQGVTQIVSQQSDGSVFTMEAPLQGPDNTYPDFGADSTGTYRRGEMQADFTISATQAAPGRWAMMETRFDGDLRGIFAVDEAFGGSGRLMEQDETVAVMSWTADGRTDVRFLSAQSEATSPAGAAEDYLRHRWQTITALLAPDPGVAGTGQSAVDNARALIVAP